MNSTQTINYPERIFVEKKKYDEETARLEKRLKELQSRQSIQ